jgi:4-hydroxybenzoyl-CoA reductase subunit alpha
MSEFAVIGGTHPKIDAIGKVTGRARYADDLSLPRMLTARLLRSTAPHARIARLDVSRAQSLRGVHAVLIGQDLPISYGIFPVSQDENALALEKVRYAGEAIAAVAAVDEETADRALKLIEVEYQPLPAVMSIAEALKAEAPLVHEEGRPRNVHRVAALEFGDVDAGFAAAVHVREDCFFYEGSTHLAIEEQSTLAEWDGSKLTMWSSTQAPHALQRVLEKVLEIPASRIRVIVPTLGGGFGGKIEPYSHELAAAKLAIVCGRPVKITLTREEVFYAHRGRHPVLMKVRTGFRPDGRITAMEFRSMLDGGAYGAHGAATLLYTGALQTTTYRIPAYRFDGLRVFTNKPACGPKRGHGTPQPRFAIECHLDKAAEELGIDPVDLRLRNLVIPHSRTVNHLRITSCALRECIDRVLEASGYAGKRGRLPHGRGVGFAVSAYLSGAALPIHWNDMAHSEVQIKVDRGGGVTVYSMATDIGQGSDSVLAFLTAETLGLPPEDIAVVTADTELTPIDLGSYSSRVTFMMGNAALEAAGRMRALVFDAVAAKLELDVESLVARGGRIFDEGDPEKGMNWTEAVRVAAATHGILVTTGSYSPPPLAGPFRGSGVGPSPAYSFTACVVEVDCDPDTGEVAVRDVWIAHDIGRTLNRNMVLGQIEGSVYMALGEALLEESAFRGGMHSGPSMLEYKSPTAMDMPEIHTILIESIDPEGPLGAKEAGQGALLPVVPAIANAVHDALGVRIDQVPILPQLVVKALREKRAGPKGLPSYDFPPPTRVDPPPGFEVPQFDAPAAAPAPAMEMPA